MDKYIGTREVAEILNKHQEVMGGYLIPEKELKRIKKEQEEEGK